MGTAWAAVIADYAMPLIDDIRLSEKLDINPAAFFRTMAQYMTAAVPLVSKPPQVVSFLTEDLIDADYQDAVWTSTEESMAEEKTVIDTGITGADIFSCVIRREDATGNVMYTKYSDAVYDTATGAVTFPKQEGMGIEYDMDFYTDGRFSHELSVRLQTLIGMAIAIVWDERFTRNWLDMTMKVHDDSFKVANESNYIKETTARLVKNRSQFAGELQKYEQDCAYYSVVQPLLKPNILI